MNYLQAVQWAINHQNEVHQQEGRIESITYRRIDLNRYVVDIVAYGIKWRKAYTWDGEEFIRLQLLDGCEHKTILDLKDDSRPGYHICLKCEIEFIPEYLSKVSRSNDRWIIWNNGTLTFHRYGLPNNRYTDINLLCDGSIHAGVYSCVYGPKDETVGLTFLQLLFLMATD